MIATLPLSVSGGWAHHRLLTAELARDELQEPHVPVT